MRILSIDPGKTGGLTIIDSETGDVIAATLMPTIKIPNHRAKKTAKNKMMKEYDLPAINAFVRLHKPDIAYCEQVGARPGQGSVSMFSFGKGLGYLLGIVSAYDLECRLVLPQVWKKHHGLIGTLKDDSLLLARTTWPAHAATTLRRKMDEGVAESMLIGKYAIDDLVKNPPQQTSDIFT